MFIHTYPKPLRFWQDTFSPYLHFCRPPGFHIGGGGGGTSKWLSCGIGGGGGLKSVDFLFCIVKLNLGAGGGGTHHCALGVVVLVDYKCTWSRSYIYVLEEEASFSH